MQTRSCIFYNTAGTSQCVWWGRRAQLCHFQWPLVSRALVTALSLPTDGRVRLSDCGDRSGPRLSPSLFVHYWGASFLVFPTLHPAFPSPVVPFGMVTTSWLCPVILWKRLGSPGLGFTSERAVGKGSWPLWRWDIPSVSRSQLLSGWDPGLVG